VGSGVVRSARTTRSPRVSPLSTCTDRALAAPVVTGVRCVVVPFTVVTTLVPFASRVTAEVGTVSTSCAVESTMLTSAREPLARAGTAVGTRTTTGYVAAVPAAVPDVAAGSRLIERTVAATGEVAPPG